MKKILVIGSESYIGNNFENCVKQKKNNYSIDKVSIRDNLWKQKSFEGYDVIFHVAGIAHRKRKKIDKDLYYKVNRDKAYEVAFKAKKEGVKQFVFLSTMSVFGVEKGRIDKNVWPNPKNEYGESKFQAEKMISSLEDNTFKVVIVRPPMVYGKGCKGNYQKLRKIALKSPLFPNIRNERSMIYVENLSEFIRFLIDENKHGLYFPQNNQYVCTSDMVKLIAQFNGKTVWLTKIFNPLINKLSNSLTNKLFGDLVYINQELKAVKSIEYNFYDLEESIKLTEAQSEKNNYIIKSS